MKATRMYLLLCIFVLTIISTVCFLFCMSGQKIPIEQGIGIVSESEMNRIYGVVGETGGCYPEPDLASCIQDGFHTCGAISTGNCPGQHTRLSGAIINTNSDSTNMQTDDGSYVPCSATFNCTGTINTIPNSTPVPSEEFPLNLVCSGYSPGSTCKMCLTGGVYSDPTAKWSVSCIDP
ncbi:MAG: hypothetical protein LBQ50_10090 [Planctomycetaceae bacterium]|jgi:hypothetical protein|nr:hypothetical protein [Planctomycetaceae bacterium]